MGLISKIKSVGTAKQPEPMMPKTESYIAYCFLGKDEDRIKVLETNPNFELSTKQLYHKGFVGKRVYKYFYRYSDATIQREPKNKHDKNAVMILVNGQFFGYVNRDDAPVIGAAIKKNQIISCAIVMTGGPYRYIISEDQSTAGGGDFDVKLEVTYK